METGEAGDGPAAAREGSGLASLRPFPWLRGYGAAAFPGDLVAGILLATYLVPISIAYASLAGLPPQAGLYASLLSGIGFAAFTGGRHTSIAVTSSLSLLTGSVLAGMAEGDPARHAALASLAALYVGAVALVARALRAGGIVAFISETILVGFKIGVATHIAVSQIPKLLGMKASGHHVAEKAISIVRGLDGVHAPSLWLGAGTLAFLWIGDRLARGKPWALAAMVGAIVAVSRTSLGEEGIRVLGDIPSGLPALGPPPVAGGDVDGLLGLALACFLLASVETVAVARTFGAKHGYRVDTNREFLALGAANLLVGLGQGYPVSGGMSQSAVNENAGARTPMSLLVACGLLALVVLFLGGFFRNLPDPVLAAVVLMAIRGLFDFRALLRLRSFGRFEFAVALLALGGVVGFGVLKGVLLAVIGSILLLLRKASLLPVAVLGRVPATGEIVRLDRDPAAEPIPGVFLARVYGSLLYFNVEGVRERLADAWRAAGRPRHAVLDLEAVPFVDIAGARLLGELRDEVAALGGEVRLANARSGVREALADAGIAPFAGDPGLPVIRNLPGAAA